ncbi:thiopurine S-methyltransferase [Endozoicomonas arenosclerae]|uniref:thiopurine S-methyltransferase n=1 Tax=Endozoicomonas arenosclerae TaxID=1633495 RepID=UPI0007844B4E|nr:thiopurine S-methyltransferase [Endozoicomonas arenosclerae]
MKSADWVTRWKEGRIGFHRPEYNESLLKYWPQLDQSGAQSVLVPLCGKSLDMIWLKQQGLEVIGTELVKMAVEAFYQEQNLQPEIQDHQAYRHWQANDIHILEGDFFELPEGSVQSTVFYDRAALIALPQTMRKQYVTQLMQTAPDLKEGLLITVEYDQDLVPGPPFSVREPEVRELFSPWFEVHKLESHTSAASTNLKEKGVNELTEAVYRLVRR